MGLFDRNVFTGLGLPVGGEGFVEFDVEFAGGVVGDVEEFDGLGGGERDGDQREEGEREEGERERFQFHDEERRYEFFGGREGLQGGQGAKATGDSEAATKKWVEHSPRGGREIRRFGEGSRQEPEGGIFGKPRRVQAPDCDSRAAGSRVFSVRSIWVTRPSWTTSWTTPNRRPSTFSRTRAIQSGVWSAAALEAATEDTETGT